MSKHRKQLSIKMLIIYMVTALLFLTSVELHIHTQDTAMTADHGAAVSISSFADELMAADGSDEITVSADSALKVKQSTVSLLAVFLLIAVMLTVLCRTFIGRLREGHTQLPLIPFHGTPPLRAPPL
jgi:predicted nucleic acid-binding Zn ribbon protein